MTAPSSAPVLVARLPHNRSGRATLKALRAGLNRGAYRLRVLNSGPRKRGTWATKREDATGLRLYLDRLPAHHDAQASARLRERIVEDAHARRQADELVQAALVGRARAEREAAELRASVASLRATLVEVGAHRDRCAQLARRVQLAQNAIPSWALWLAGFWRDVCTWGRRIAAFWGLA